MISDLVDNAIGLISPARMLARKQARLSAARHDVALSTYRAATRSRLNADYRPKNVSADAAILPDMAFANAAARDMVRDDGYARSYVRFMTRNVVGTGMLPAPQVRKPDGSLDEATNKALKDLFFDWGKNKKLVDKEQRRTFWGVQKWLVSEFSQVGEAFIVLSYERKSQGVGLTLQLVESEQLDRYKTEANGNEVRGGIEVDAYGAPLAYWVYPRHPNDVVGMARPSPLMLESKPIPADRVIHFYDPERARQTRGITPMTASVERLRNLSEYDRCQLIAARAEASIGMVITTDEAPATQPLGLGENGQPIPADADGNDQLAMQPFMVARLGTNEKMESFIPQRPGNMYAPFVVAQLRAIAASLGVSYEQIARDFTTTNFSGLRQALSEDRKEVELTQKLLVESALAIIWNEFVACAVIEGRMPLIPAMGFVANPDKYTYCNWRGSGFRGIDPAKDQTAKEKAIAIGTMTLEDAAQDDGKDWREIADQQAVEQKYRASKGLGDMQAAQKPISTVAPDAQKAAS